MPYTGSHILSAAGFGRDLQQAGRRAAQIDFVLVLCYNSRGTSRQDRLRAHGVAATRGENMLNFM